MRVIENGEMDSFSVEKLVGVRRVSGRVGFRRVLMEKTDSLIPDWAREESDESTERAGKPGNSVG